MIRFENDFNCGAHPAVLGKLARANNQSYSSYGTDTACAQAADLIRKTCESPNVQVHFLIGGTQANYTLIGHALRPWESVISADGGHINSHETGAVEHTGHKINACPAVNGKATAEGVRFLVERYVKGGVQEHVTRPKLVYLSTPSETGSIYSKREIEELRTVCDEYGMYLFVDGARMAYGLGSPENDLTIADYARLTDAFWIGGTKCGALFGEALVLVNPELFDGFRASMKQGGGLLAKGFLLGLQFQALFEGGLYFRIGKEADEKAEKLKHAFRDAGIPLAVENSTNMTFVLLDDNQVDELGKRFTFEFEGRAEDGRSICRFCTSWSTTDEEVEVLARAVKGLQE